jgi:hypothetical protein
VHKIIFTKCYKKSNESFDFFFWEDQAILGCNENSEIFAKSILLLRVFLSTFHGQKINKLKTEFLYIDPTAVKN